jgi:hypothetical protein
VGDYLPALALNIGWFCPIIGCTIKRESHRSQPMLSNADPIVTQIRNDLEALMTYVTGAESAQQRAATVELTVFRRLLALGAALLQLFFATRTAVRPPAPTAADGTRLPYHDHRSRRYRSVFGELTIRRHYFHAPGQAGCCPVDAALSLPDRCYSDLLRDWTGYDATDGAYRETATMVARILGLEVSVQALETNLQADAQDVDTFYAQPRAACPTGTILVVQADGKGVPMVQPPHRTAPVRLGKGQKRTTKKEAVVTSLSSIAPYVRTPADVRAALLHEEQRADHPARPVPVQKEVRATLAGKATAMAALQIRAHQRDGTHIQARVALTDGADSLQQHMQTTFPTFTLVLDIIHASAYLWRTATALLGERSTERLAWVRTNLDHL